MPEFNCNYAKLVFVTDDRRKAKYISVLLVRLFSLPAEKVMEIELIEMKKRKLAKK